MRTIRIINLRNCRSDLAARFGCFRRVSCHSPNLGLERTDHPLECHTAPFHDPSHVPIKHGIHAMRYLLMLTVAVAVTAGTVQAQEKKNAPGPRSVGAALNNPTGVAIHPKTGDVIVAERRGIVRFLAEKPENGKRRHMEVNRFPGDKYGKGPIYDIGPLGIAFIDDEHLVVGDGSQVDTDEVIRVYELHAKPAEKAIAAKDAEVTLGPLDSSDELKAEGNYYGVAVTAGHIYATANGDDTKGWIVRAKLDDHGHPADLERFIATKEAVEVDAPVAITVNSDGDLVVGQMGEITVPGDSLLSVYDPKTGKLKSNHETGLDDITGLAYSPASGKLYATDFSWHDTSKGALYELTVSGDQCNAKKVAELDKPTALAFDKDGHLYVTIIGTPEEGSDKPSGKVLRLSKRFLANN